MEKQEGDQITIELEDILHQDKEEKIHNLREEYHYQSHMIILHQQEGGGAHSHSRNQGERYDKPNIQCHYCNKFVHFASKCRKKQYDMNKQKDHFTNENQPNTSE